MKVYVASEYGFEHDTILGIFFEEKDANDCAEERRKEIQKEWEEVYNNLEDEDHVEMLRIGPFDKTHVWETIVR
jgi:hypothetical protein